MLETTVSERSADGVCSKRGRRQNALLGRLAVVVSCLGILLLGLLFPFPVNGRVWSNAFDLGHAPAFFLIYVIVAAILDPRCLGLSEKHVILVPLGWRKLTLLAITLLGGGVTGELLQHLSGRQPSVGDVAANGAGILAGFLCVIAFRLRRSLRNLMLTIASGTLLAISLPPILQIWDSYWQEREFPLLSSFERLGEMGLWSEMDSMISRSEEWAAAGRYSLRIDLVPAMFSGVGMNWPNPDWTKANTLQLTLHNPGARAISMVLKISDAEHVNSEFDPLDRFHQKLTIAAGGTETYSIRLKDVESSPATRRMHMDRITQVELYCVDPESSATVYMDHLILCP